MECLGAKYHLKLTMMEKISVQNAFFALATYLKDFGFKLFELFLEWDNVNFKKQDETLEFIECQ